MLRQSRAAFTLVVILILPISIGFPVVEASTAESRPMDSPQRVYGMDVSRSVFSRVSFNSFQNLIIELTENGPRPAGSQSAELAKNWIADQLVTLSNGRIDVQILGDYESVVGRLPGYLPGPNPVLMVGGHYDTVHAAPGANDDGTGVAGTLELARVLSEYDWPLDIYFGAWNAEEIGLFGSREVAQIFVEQEIDILVYYNIDMLLVENINAAPDERVLMAYGKEAVHLAELTRMMSNNHGRNLVRPTRSSDFSGWSRSDHASFIAEGYERSLFAFESGFSRDSAYHTPDDTWDNPLYNYTVAREAVAAIGASMAFIQGREFSEPIHTELQTGFRDGGSDRLYIEAASESILDIWAGWNNGGFAFKLYNPMGVLMESVEFDEPNSDTKLIFSAEVNKSGLYSIVVSTESDGISGVSIVAEYDTDVEADGILDSEQFWLDNSFFALDDDEDGLSNGLEIIYGTSISNSDSDEDSIPDLWEVENGLDPLYNDAQSDLDNDGLSNLLEYEIGTSPEKTDSDDDYMPDAWEYEHGLDPTIDDGAEDQDNDMLSNLQEFEIGTYPNNSDSDSDSLDDYSEHHLYGTNPLCNDSDQDEMPDAWELRYSLDPLLNDSGLDPDGDMLTNLEEYLRGSNPILHESLLGSVPIFAISLALIILAPLMVWHKYIREP
ncbi:MAG: M28 family peptidase [Candidatus Thorarchaeota archaeon]|jgi:hypothetical protein